MERNNEILVTVFTPTYNRAYTLTNLYNSLVLQTNMNFEWLVVDDGSSDNTKELINNFIADDKLSICYFKQKNGGKHRAINRGVLLAEGELFFIVDSDDYLSNNAIERMVFYYEGIRNNGDFAGVSGVRAYPNGKRIGGEHEFQTIDSNTMEIVFKYGLKGDLSQAYKTEVLRKYPFPEFQNEKFCPEGAVWFKIAQKYKLRFFNEKIYFCEYLPDGLTHNMVKNRVRNPMGYIKAYGEGLKNKIPVFYKLKYALSCWRVFYFTNKEYKVRDLNSFIGVKYLWLAIPGFLIYLNDRIIFNRNK